MSEGLGWYFADQVLELSSEMDKLPWWRWRRRRELRRRAEGLVVEAAEFGLDLGPLFGLRGQLRLGLGKRGSEG